MPSTSSRQQQPIEPYPEPQGSTLEKYLAEQIENLPQETKDKYLEFGTTPLDLCNIPLCQKDQTIDIYCIKIQIKINNLFFSGLALVDTGCSRTKIDSSKILGHYLKPYVEPQVRIQMIGSKTYVTHYVSKAHLIIMGQCRPITYTMLEIPIRNLSPHIYIAMLGLDFILNHNATMIVHRDHITFTQHSHTVNTINPYQSALQKCGGTPPQAICNCNYNTLRETLEII